MKYTLLMAFLLVGQLGYAQTLKAMKVKEEMLDRTDRLIQKIELTRTDLDRLDTVPACEKIRELEGELFEQVKDIVQHMNVFDRKVVKTYQEGLVYRDYLKRQIEVCEQGENCEMVAPAQVEKQLKAIQKSLKKQRKFIQKGDTGYNNTFKIKESNSAGGSYKYHYKYEYKFGH